VVGQGLWLVSLYVCKISILYELYMHILFLAYLRYRTMSALTVSLVDPLSPP